MIWLFLLPLTLEAQKNNFNKIIDSEISKEIKIKKLDSISFKIKHDSLQHFYSNYSNWLYKNKKTKKAIYYRKKALLINNTNKQLNLYYLGKYLIQYKKYKKAIKHLNNSLKINAKNNLAIYTYYELGKAYNKLGDLPKSILYYKLTINLNNNNNKVLINSSISIQSISSKIGDYKNLKEGIYYGLLVDSISDFSKTSKRNKYLIKFFLAKLHNQYELLDIKKSFHYYRQALALAKQENDTLKITQTLINIADLYNTTNTNKSIFYNNKALSICKNTDTVNLRMLYSSYSLTLARAKLYIKSIDYNHQSLAYLLGDDLRTYNKNAIIRSNKKIILLFMLPTLAETYFKHYEQSNEIIYLKKSIAYYKLTDFTLDLLKVNSDQFKSRLFWRKQSANIYGKAIKTCFLNNNIEQAFYFMEKNKALLLMEDLATQNYRQTLDVPMASLEEENNLKQTILIAKNELESKITQIKKDSLNKVLLDTNRELLTLQDSIYKGEKVTKKEPKILNIKEVQQNLKENEVFVEYHVSIDDGYGIYTNRENGYVVVLTKNKKYFFEINHLSILKEEVTTLINALKSPFKTNEDFSKYNALAHTVYKKLFPTQEVRDLLKNKKVRIASDSYLSLLPFETLITQINKNDKLNQPNYLIKEANISYVYSYSFLKHNTFTKNENKQFLGYAPTSFNYDDLSEINNSKSEILNLKNYYNGDHFINEKATKKSFLKNIENYNIIHLATHANAQDSINPWIAFKNEKLNLEELYLAKNNASLVVLSGCNTTLGKQEIGEGIMSLARGFFYGGSQSVISSLWNVDDTATPYIMNKFYKNLSHGKTKSEALHLAKLNYLDKHSLSEASPHFWASFILLGQDNVVETDRNYSIWWIACLVIVILGLLFYVWKKKQTTLIHGK